MLASSRWLLAPALAGLLANVAAAQVRFNPLSPFPPTAPAAPALVRPALAVTGPAARTLGAYPVVPNPFIAPVLVLGQPSIIPPDGFGFNPYLSSAATGPALSPSTLATATASNPYLGGAATLADSTYGDGYSLSTTPNVTPPVPPLALGYGPFVPPFAASLDGYVNLTRATGQYRKDISQARLHREFANQAVLDTARRRAEFVRWYESIKLTAPQMCDRERATDLERVRKDATAAEVWSGKALNDLLRSIRLCKLNSARSPSLDQEMLGHINLTDQVSRGNAGMLKDGGKLDWPEALREEAFDKPRTRLTRAIRLAVEQLRRREPLAPSRIKDIRADFQALNKAVEQDAADNLSVAHYIESRRFLNQLSSAIQALTSRVAISYFNGNWSARGKNVAELVAHMNKAGLSFAPAAPGDEAAYNALYLALRNYEAALQPSASSSEK